MKTIIALLTFVLSCGVAHVIALDVNPAQNPTNVAGELRSKVPDGWVSEPPSSRMRVAQFKLPKTQGDTEDASLVVYFFGQTQGGSVEANIERWIGQIEQPDGGSSREKAKLEKLTVNGLNVTALDVAGTYTAEMSPGSATHYNKPGYRLRGAIVETPKGFYFAKLTGPEKTVSHWNQAFTDYVKSFDFK